MMKIHPALVILGDAATVEIMEILKQAERMTCMIAKSDEEHKEVIVRIVSAVSIAVGIGFSIDKEEMLRRIGEHHDVVEAKMSEKVMSEVAKIVREK